ncbi:MAG: Uma2 family endonuclease [Leptolyngbyaceae bacterium]|nr:Uma2 family endonuclease [Leptolyngbyaceae bacterium]
MTQAIPQNYRWDDCEPETPLPPTDLWSDEPPLESDLHREQIDLLIRLLKWWWRERDTGYASGNITIYYKIQQLEVRELRSPDFFVVMGVEKRVSEAYQRSRRSWIVWAEDGKYPHLIVELLSRSTAAVDRGAKKQLYQDTFRTPDYVWFHPDTLEFNGFHLGNSEYQEIEPNEHGWLWIKSIGLYLGIRDRKLRFFTQEGMLVPLPEEEERQRADHERQRAEQESQRAEQERQRAEAAEAELERLRAELRSQQIPNQD